jgi:hypothetical protein
MAAPRMERRFTGFAATAATTMLFAIACAGPGATPDADSSPASEQGNDGVAAMSEPITVKTGTHIMIRLAEPVSTSDNHDGDRFEAVVVDAVEASDGSVAIPAGAAAHGTVVQSHQSTGPDDPAVIAVRIDGVDVNGTTRPLDAHVVSADPATSAGDSNAETAGKIAIGAAAGAILGQIVGKDTRSTIAGAGAGAVAGTVIALSTRKGNATLENGSVIVVELEEPITLH